MTTIANPILNSAFREPTRHFRFDEDGITAAIEDGRRLSTYFVPIPRPRKRGGQLSLGIQGGWGAERMKANDFINDIRRYVAQFRASDYPGVTATTRELLRYWRDLERERPLFFCQVEALETAIFILEVAQHREPWIEARLREFSDTHNQGLYRIALKMATGSGKTVVMAMLIAWQALNKLANPRDRRFSDTFLVVTPGITIRDRLRVLLPNDPGNYYAERDLAPPEQIAALQQANILVTNFHAFLQRDTLQASTTTKRLLAPGDPDRFKETPDQVVRRACRALGNKRNIVVLNDEAHHCYQSAPTSPDDKPQRLTADERAEATERERDAKVWLNGLRAVRAKLGIRAIFDLSATPFFLKGSGYQEGDLFPWVVSDFSLIDAIESGVVKIPRVPVTDDTMATTGPVFRELWPLIREHLPRSGRATETLGEDRPMAAALEDALRQLYGNYRRSYDAWERAGAGTPPVFIVVCQNTNISKLVFDWIAGRERTINGQTVLVPGNLPLFSNVAEGAPGADNIWIDRPNTLLIDSAQLESGEAMDPAFKRIAAREIEEFKRELLARGREGATLDEITDEELLREVMNTVGRKGRLGEQVRCVVSVSMLTEGWDANTVTHILGVRAFGTQLLCEQVVGRGLRRVSYDPDEQGMFAPEYAEVYGIPFSFIPTTGSSTEPPVQKEIHRVYALPDRVGLELTFPHVMGYRFDLPTERLDALLDDEAVMVLSTHEIPTWTEMDPVVGESATHSLEDLKARRMQEVAFRVARRTLDRFFTTHDCDPDGNCATGTIVLSIDATDPEVTCDSRDPVFLLRAADATIGATVADGLSGPVDATLSAAADTTRVGPGSVELTGRDRAGNRTVVTCDYTVAYAFEGFFSPVDGGNVLNVVNAGRAVPLKWRLTDAAGAPLIGLATAEVTVRSLDCALGSSTDLIAETTTGGSSLQDLGDGYYQLNWKTPKSYARSCKTMRLDLGDGTLHTALFQFTR